MGEGTLPVAIAQGPDAWHIGTKLVVHPDVAPLIHFDACLLQAEVIRVGATSDSKKQMRPTRHPRATFAVEVDHYLIAFFFRTYAFGLETDVNSLVFENLLDRFGHVFVIALDQPRPHLDDGHLTAQAPIHLPELQADVASADDDQVLREEVHLHHGGIGQVGHALEAGHGRDECSRPHVDEDFVRLQPFRTYTERVGTFEARVALVHHAVLHVLEPAFHTLVGPRHHTVFARFDLLHVHGDGATDHHAKVGTPPGHVRSAGAGHQGLRGNAAGIDTGAAKEFALDDGHLHPRSGQPRCQGWPGLPRTNDYRFIFGRHDIHLLFLLAKLVTPVQPRSGRL